MAKSEAVGKERKEYIEGIGRRKTATARVRIYPKESKAQIIVNGLPLKSYFPVSRLAKEVIAPLFVLSEKNQPSVEVKVRGGGPTGQAEAITLGLARALVKLESGHKLALRAKGYLTRDPRVVERKKYGLRKARRAPQWKKR